MTVELPLNEALFGGAFHGFSRGVLEQPNESPSHIWAYNLKGLVNAMIGAPRTIIKGHKFFLLSNVGSHSTPCYIQFEVLQSPPPKFWIFLSCHFVVGDMAQIAHFWL